MAEEQAGAGPSAPPERDDEVALIVEDDPGIARAISQLVPGGLTTVVVSSVAAALGALAMPAKLAGAIIDIGLPDGSGIKVVEFLRARDLELPILVLTAALDRNLINQVHSLGAEYVCKPEFGGNLKEFLRRIDPETRRLGRFSAVLEAARERYRLTDREVTILAESLDGIPRGRLAEVLGVSENTLKTQIRSLLDKTSRNSLSEAVWLVRNLKGTPEAP
ncbi:MAG: response regulator [Myxococcota bacterium]